ncbi:MAG TPA: membrane-bound PQQ-dependent dehydrogenase, glucose/quinate/shikimate family [Steroidobacteraceae bacterium]|nr:membrane-bound PQQ-dependent dehydrogenase, glucose/quinate/shikimate family [Steroidobacteraceae bacterium]
MNTSRIRPPFIFAAIVTLLGVAMLPGGIQLASLGGSLYYLMAGFMLVAAGVQLFRGRYSGAWLYGLTLLCTLIWGVFEVGFNLWALLPRLLALSVIGTWLLTPWARRSLQGPATFSESRGGIAALAIAAITLVIGIAVSGTDVAPIPERLKAAASAEPVTDWRNYGNGAGGTRYAQLDQITPANAGKLKKLWHVRTSVQGAFKNTPTQIGDLLYVCAGANVLMALDADTGETRWQSDSKVTIPRFGGFGTTCRGVAYHKAPDSYDGECKERILTATTDARLIAVDALTGQRCASFGEGGELSLLKHMGNIKPGFHFTTSPPTIAGDVAVVGGWVADNQEVGEPSGVVRAFDVMTGRFAWAWDLGRPGIHTEPAEGESYTHGTPNAWSVFSYDPKLNLVYLPVGNATPDYFGAHRSQESEEFASSVVALDAATGSVRWHFQTVHHDIWDYDVPSQPVLFDLPQADGSVIPALVQGTKRGELFLFDRRDGKPLTEIKELPVPQGAVEGDWVAKTQPFSVGMPNFRPDVREADMWGITPYDQLWCRITFKKLRYEGHFTPLTVKGTFQFPGNAGGFNWGSVAVDEDKQLLIANPLIMGNRIELIPRANVPEGTRGGLQLGTPYAVTTQPFMSPLSVPCQRPPYGVLAVIDLQTQKLVWSKPVGMANESGPLGIASGLRLPLGAPLSAGTAVTKGGVIFMGGSMDRYFRAVDVTNGEELWRDYLPGTAQANPMTYLGPKSKKQIVVITVPNAQRRFGYAVPPNPSEPEDPLGGHVIAYALED